LSAGKGIAGLLLLQFLRVEGSRFVPPSFPAQTSVKTRKIEVSLEAGMRGSYKSRQKLNPLRTCSAEKCYQGPKPKVNLTPILYLGGEEEIPSNDGTTVNNGSTTVWNPGVLGTDAPMAD